MNPLQIIQKYYNKNEITYNILVEHSIAVAKKAVEIAKKVPHLKPDIKFIQEAAMLHDIGIFQTNAPKIGCFGTHPYVEHGYLGRIILENEGFYKHAIVCETHVGTGLTVDDIINQKLNIPHRNMEPKTIEEEIICYADKFFSKSRKNLSEEKSIEKIKKSLIKHGEHKVVKFEAWMKKFDY